MKSNRPNRIQFAPLAVVAETAKILRAAAAAEIPLAASAAAAEIPPVALVVVATAVVVAAAAVEMGVERAAEVANFVGAARVVGAAKNHVGSMVVVVVAAVVAKVRTLDFRQAAGLNL